MNTHTKKNIALGNIITVPSRNTGRGSNVAQWFKDAAEMIYLASLFVVRGWRHDRGGMSVVRPTAFYEDKALKACLKEASEHRGQYLSFFTEDTYTMKVVVGTGDEAKERDIVLTKANIEKHYALLYGPKPSVLGKVETLYDQINGYRRKFVAPIVNAAREVIGLPAIEKVEVEIRTYSDKSQDGRNLARAIDCLSENEQKSEGVLEPTMAMKLRAIKSEFFDRCLKENAARVVYKAGTTQKLWAFLKLCELMKVKGFDLWGTLWKEKNPSKKLSSLSKEELRKLHKSNAAVHAVKAYFADPGTRKGSTMMSSSDIKDFASQMPNPFIRCGFRAAATGDRASVDFFTRPAVKEDYTNAFLDAARKVAKKHGEEKDLQELLEMVSGPIE
jgi:hypothetical protein